VVIGGRGEQGLPGLADVEGMLDQGIWIHIGFADLALGPVLAEEPVVGERSGVLVPGLPHHVGRVPLELLQLPFTNP
jgi:hypothetical protein